MQKQDIETILASQRKFFATGKTLPISWRLEQLKKLRASMLRHEEDLYGALKKDLGKSRMESYMCEIGLTLSELTWMEKHIRRLTHEKRVPTPLAQFAARSFQSPTPYGTVLIMSPWNYPVLLTLEPLIDALAAGNTVIVKPSAYAPATSAVMEMIIKETYPPEYVRMITGGRQENQALLTQRFDKIFFTGGKTVGREVLRHAAEYLTPVTLELGGKSPCIVDSTAKIPLAARRIVFGKYLNCGQTCVAPDYILCDVSIKDALLAAIQKEITRQFGDRPLDNPDYGKIINEKHFERILGLIAKENVVATFGMLFGFAEVAENGSEIWGNLAQVMTPIAAYGFLVFNLLCAPCFAAMGAIKREMNNTRWFWIAIGYQCGLAYVVSLCVYQIGTLITTGAFGIGTVVAFLLIIGFIYLLFRPYKESTTLKVDSRKVA